MFGIHVHDGQSTGMACPGVEVPDIVRIQWLICPPIDGRRMAKVNFRKVGYRGERIGLLVSRHQLMLVSVFPQVPVPIEFLRPLPVQWPAQYEATVDEATALSVDVVRPLVGKEITVRHWDIR